MSKQILTFSNLKTNPIRKNTNNTTFSFGVCLDGVPEGDVTVSFASTLSKFTASAALTFTTLNYNTPQTLTITSVDDSVVDIVIKDTLTISCSGGGYDGVTKDLTVSIYDSVSWPYGTLFGHVKWTDQLHVTASNYDSKRLEAIDFIFNSNGIPSGTSNVAVSAGFSGNMHLSINTTTLTGVASVDKLTITWEDAEGTTWTHYVYHIKASTGGNTKLLIDSLGVQSTDTYDHTLLINTCTAAGIDVLYLGMPVTGQNTEDGGTITLTQSAGWNQMLSAGLDTVDYNPMELFFFDVAKALNHIDANYNYSSIGITGVHAGAWVALVYGAMDARINRVFPIRGLNPRTLDDTSGPYPLGDNLTNNGSRIYTFYNDSVSMVDYMAICAKAKYIKVLDHTGDASSADTTARLWVPVINAKINGTIDTYISTASGTATPAYYEDFIDEIISEM